MNDQPVSKPFSLSAGGLFYRFIQLINLEGDDPYHVRLRIGLLVGFTWLPLLILSILEGTIVKTDNTLPFFYDPDPHAKLLIALPLLVAAGEFINPLLDSALQYLNASGILPEKEKARYNHALDQIARRRDSIWVEAALLVFAWALTIGTHFFYEDVVEQTKFSTWVVKTVEGEGSATLAGWWYLYIDLPLVQFMLFRWLWRYGIWIDFLRSLSKIPLALKPTHCDRAGGIGFLGSAHYGFGMVFVAMATMISPGLADQILYTGSTFEEAKQIILVFMGFCAVAIVGPLFLFIRQLYWAKRQALRLYGLLQDDMSQTFHQNWLTTKKSGLVDSPEPSSMADYSGVYQNINNMRIVPIPRRGTIMLAACLVLPFFPLWLIKIPLMEMLLIIGKTLF